MSKVRECNKDVFKYWNIQEAILAYESYGFEVKLHRLKGFIVRDVSRNKEWEYSAAEKFYQSSVGFRLGYDYAKGRVL